MTRTITMDQYGNFSVSNDPDGAIAVALFVAANHAPVGAALSPDGPGVRTRGIGSIERATSRDELPPPFDEDPAFDPDTQELWILFREPVRPRFPSSAERVIRGDELRDLVTRALALRANWTGVPDKSAPAAELAIGTRMTIDALELAKTGIPGGYTRKAWRGWEETYADIVFKTSEQRIQFVLLRSPDIIEMTAIHYAVKVPTGGLVPVRDPKPIFEKERDLDTFEQEMRPYMSAKIEALRSGSPPSDGAIVTVDVPVRTVAGSDASVRVAFPWHIDANTHKNKLLSWWVDPTAFAKGGPFNP